LLQSYREATGAPIGNVARMVLVPLLVLAVLVLVSCETAYYATMEKLGYPKRALLVSRVQQARDSQQAAKEQCQSALERFRAVVNVRGGELEAK
jgi:flagellar basal body-associated protein FliL